jgi:lysophospholipase L1-like esterase
VSAWSFTPGRALGALLAAAGAGVVAANLVEPDESRALGAVALSVGLALLVAPETAGRRRLVESLVALVLVLAGGEAMVRRETRLAQAAYADRLMHFVEDGELRYEFKPGVRCSASTLSSLGMLDVERSREKPEGTLRIACLGDSVGGDCDLPRENACAQLEKQLTAARGGRPVEVLNFSVPGYNTIQEARALETKALAFAPDAVVLLYVINDPYPDLAVSQFIPGHFKFEHLLFTAAMTAGSRVIPALDPMGTFFRQLYTSPRSWDGVVVRGFDRIAAATEGRHLPVVVAVFPMFVPAPSAQLPGYYAQVAAEAARHGFVALDLSQTAFKGVPLGGLLKPSRDAIHPNAAAHERAAATIGDALLARHRDVVLR